MSAFPALQPGAADVLKRDDPALLLEARKKREEADKIRYPEPTLGDLQRGVEGLRAAWEPWVQKADEFEKVRFLRDEMPEKYKRQLEGEVRIRSRLSHNEILRVVSMLTRNGYKVDSPSSGTSGPAQASATKRKRWGKEFFPSMERKARSPLRRIILDSATSIGMGAWELYRTEAYHGLDDETLEVKDGETEEEYEQRTDGQLKEQGCPYGLRAITGKALKYLPDEDGLCKAVIIEWKAYRQVYADALENLSAEKLEELRMPKPGDQGWTNSVSAWGQNYIDGTGSEPLVETWRYYDRRWFVYVVAGRIVEGPVLHHWGRVPIFPVEGIVTSSSLIAERIQGITYGMIDLETALNDQLTYAHDTTITYGKPKPVVEIMPGGSQMLDRQKNPVRIDLTSAGAPQLPVGAHIVDAYREFQPKLTELFTGTLLNLWQRSGINPVAQGASPGADPAGYTVNTLITAANDLYQTILENDARAAGEVLDTVMADIRDNYGDQAFLPSEGSGEARGTVEFLGLGPKDISKAPMRVTIDPSSEQNRMARVQQLTDGWKSGVVPRQVLQIDGYGAESTEDWDDLIVEEQVEQRLTPMLVDLAFQEIMRGVAPQAFQSMYGTTQQAPASSGLVDAQGNPLPPSGGGGGAGAPGGGGEMAPPQPASVGGAAAAASDGASGGANFSTVMAGQDRGYVPPASASAPAPQ